MSLPAACLAFQGSGAGRAALPMGLSAALPARETWNQSAAGSVPSFIRRTGSASSVPRDAVPDPFAVRHWHHVLSPITRVLSLFGSFQVIRRYGRGGSFRVSVRREGIGIRSLPALDGWELSDMPPNSSRVHL